MRLRNQFIWLVAAGGAVVGVRWLLERPVRCGASALVPEAALEAAPEAAPLPAAPPAAAAPPATPRRRRAGILYLRITSATEATRAGTSPWPQWLPAVEASAAANADEVTYYFAGPATNFSCPNCVSIPTDLDALLGRVEAHLGVDRAEVAVKSLKHKICDLKPMWPTLFPEVAAAHEFVGYADLDVIFGDLAAEVRALRDGDDLLVPSSWYPSPLANGNFLLFRSERRVLDIFRRHAGWREALTTPGYDVYDEWHGKAPERTFMHALLEEHLNGRLRPRPTARLFLQDVVGPRNLWDRPASVRVRWERGALVAAYDGPCVCAKDMVPQFSIAQCAQCVRRPGEKLENVVVTRELEVLAYHMLSAKFHVVDVEPRLANCSRFDLTKADDSLKHTFACR
jgi:hypothetical protein